MQSGRNDKITDIQSMLGRMSDEQVENVHTYTTDEYIEPNHEAVALEAVIQISRKYGNRAEPQQCGLRTPDNVEYPVFLLFLCTHMEK